jgi:hypothetical protein
VPAPRKFDAETMARAVRMYQDRLTERGESKLQARRAVGAFAARGRRPRHSRQDPAAGGPGSPDDTPHHVVPSTPSSSWVLRCDIKALRLFCRSNQFLLSTVNAEARQGCTWIVHCLEFA